MRAAHREVEASLRTSWNRKLYRWWAQYNDDYLHGALNQPLIELDDGIERLGQWDSQRRRISISASHIERDPWSLVLDTLRHEMAHQYVSEVLDSGGSESAHGASFRETCGLLRCSPRARSTVTEGDKAGESRDDRIHRRLRKILSLAASANEHEAQVAVNKAQRIMLEYNIDIVEFDREREFGNRALGPIKGRHAAWELWLAMVLNGFFFVEVLWGWSYDALKDREGTTLIVYGTETNLDMAEYVYDYVSALLDRLWQGYKKEAGLESNRERMRYYAGVIQGFYSKLEEDRQRASAETALVWKGDSRLGQYYSYLNPNVVTRRSGGVSASAAYVDGLSDGRLVNIHKPVSSTSAGFGGYLNAGSR
jgi:hypothetical protein